MENRKKLQWSVALVGLALAAGLGWPVVAARAGLVSEAAMESFIVREIFLEGLVAIPEQDVAELLSVRQGQTIFDVDLAQAGRRLEAHPLVESVEIRRQIPSTLYVRVVERRPRFVLESGDRRWMIDKSGVVISRVTENAEVAGFAVIDEKGLDEKKILPGARLSIKGLQPMVAAAYRLKNYRLFGKYEFAGLGAFGKQRLVARFAGTDVVVKALKEGWTDELERLLTVDYTLRGKEERIVSIDLSFENKVVVQFAGGEEEKVGVN
ncbi:MAG: FtsQ-type POTRA domain-containing protein [Nitrospinota bacterium]|nr:FtsQ-type POTRA domain-containing protein [Nitrospinota bacterium]MDH5677987.1 FtsQ-type POTRA domain-containing protein [Nitrospinota bacterium]MDH5755395.1 FtsQ-type POTRA domain-containing protein [Nitrospinota bacterium]